MTRVVALGGGHGLAATLAAARRYADDLCAIVSVADDGGSSGRLRAAFGIPPPGDLRKCLVALADPDSLWTSAFEHRFDAGELQGHAFGNLVLAGLAASTGDFEQALAEAGRLLGAVGRVVPATTEPVVLKAVIRGEGGDGGDSITGQVAVGSSEGIAGVSLVPADAQSPAAALDALARAVQVVIGPGSLFTSVLAVVVVGDVRDALASTPGRKVYVCNLRPQLPET
ncbi:MAG TPA: gluconeogenesis factor YvcK family protein, partial [Acidimicrobiales bacterium]|nr:gluconeogenesis factor YvcK family protein [Acidimicrobiales bacterium]